MKAEDQKRILTEIFSHRLRAYETYPLAVAKHKDMLDGVVADIESLLIELKGILGVEKADGNFFIQPYQELNYKDKGAQPKPEKDGFCIGFKDMFGDKTITFIRMSSIEEYIKTKNILYSDKIALDLLVNPTKDSLVAGVAYLMIQHTYSITSKPADDYIRKLIR